MVLKLSGAIEAADCVSIVHKCRTGKMSQAIATWLRVWFYSANWIITVSVGMIKVGVQAD